MCSIHCKKLAQFLPSKNVHEKLISEGECLDRAKEEAVPDRCVSGEHHEYGDSYQAADHALLVKKGHLLSTKTDADRHQEQWVRYQPDHYRE